MWLRSLALSAAVVLAGSEAIAAGPDEASLRAADAEQMRIIVDEDANAQQAFMHDNYIINGPSNQVLRKPRLMQMLSQGAMASDTFQRTIEAVQITDNVGIVMGRETVAPSRGSQLAKLHGPSVLQRRFTNVFYFNGGKWRFLARQATLVASPPPNAP
ncbi:MAG: nuclear transport factor 2 family protein [Pseudomonadota bacterium]